MRSDNDSQTDNNSLVYNELKNKREATGACHWAG